MARLLGTQRALAVCPNSFLINLQKQLTEEYNQNTPIEGGVIGYEIQNQLDYFGGEKCLLFSYFSS